LFTSSPPEIPDNRSDFGKDFFFGENDVRHVINRDGGEHRIYKFNPGSVRKRISLVSREF
jgi:hypothetical protein